MEDTFKIYVHRLKEGHTETISENLTPEFMDVHEAELIFKDPVSIQGNASVADETLVLRLHIETEATMPCLMCNKNVQIKISISDFCYTESLTNIKRGIFDYREVLREAILLEIPFNFECNQGDCPERSAMAQYFSKKEHSYGRTT